MNNHPTPNLSYFRLGAFLPEIADVKAECHKWNKGNRGKWLMTKAVFQ